MLRYLLSQLLVLLCLSLVFPGVAQAQAQAKPDKPNIILILADDLGFETVGAYGGRSYRTPNIDALAAKGIKFERAYATPLCTNSRVQLMTGYYNNRNWKAFGILDPQAKTIGHYMQDAGYKTLMVGKWQLTSYDPVDFPGAALRRGTGMQPQLAGFDEYSLWHARETEDKGSRYADPVIEQNGKILPGTKGRYSEDIWTDYLLDFAHRQSAAGKPFFAYYAMALPHSPWTPTPDSADWADPAKRKLNSTRYFGDMVEYADKLVGRIVGQLEAKGLADDTLILFYSDNGTDPLILSNLDGRMVQGGKSFANELGIRVPLLAYWAGHTPTGGATHTLVDSTDFLPTLLDLAGARGQTAFDGRSFLPHLLGRKGPERPWVYIHQDPRPGFDKDRFHLLRVALDKKFKLYEDGRLFPLDGSDIYEERPVMPQGDTSAMRKSRKALQAVLDSMKPYALFDPTVQPRPDIAAELYKGYFYADATGYVVMEAETPPFPIDESWRYENAVPGYSGRGYLRALRDQPESPAKGAIRFPVQLFTSGQWHLGIRYRHDHADPAQQNGLWVRIDGGDWQLYRSAPASKHAGWQWRLVGKDGALEKPMQLEAGLHTIEIAPRHDNVKLDRIVLYRAERDGREVRERFPESDFNPYTRD